MSITAGFPRCLCEDWARAKQAVISSRSVRVPVWQKQEKNDAPEEMRLRLHDFGAGLFGF